MKLQKLTKKFELVQLLGSQLVESGHIQSVDLFLSDMSQMEEQWCLVRDNVVASYEALTQVGLHRGSEWLPWQHGHIPVTSNQMLACKIHTNE